MIHKDKRMKVAGFYAALPAAVGAITLVGYVVNSLLHQDALTTSCVFIALGLCVAGILSFGFSIDWNNLSRPDPEPEQEKAPKPTSAIS